MRERHQLSFGLRLEREELHHSAIQTKKELDFSGFFHQVTVRQPIGKQDSFFFELFYLLKQSNIYTFNNCEMTTYDTVRAQRRH